MQGALFPAVPEGWVAGVEDGVVVVDKPAGIPCLGARGTTTGDLATRLGRARSSEPSCPSPLDVSASGLVLFGETKEARRRLARAAEKGPSTTAWLAVVRGDRIRDGLLEHRIRKTRRGLAAEPAKGDAATAVTSLRVRERGPGVSLVELVIEAGRPAQLRAQLAAVGAPIAGDRQRNGPAARRLMLHSAAVRLDGASEVRSDMPEELLGFLAEGANPWPHTTEALVARLRAAAALRWGLAASVDGRAQTNAFRIVDGVGDGISGLAVDVYGDHLVAHVYPDLLPVPEERVLDALAGLGAAGVYLKRRTVQANELVDTRRDEIAPANAVRGEDAPFEMVILEEGVPYLARLGDGLSTGIFLDQRDNRGRVRGWAPGKSVLNLFAYSCPFTVAASAAGAEKTVSVDVSGPALEMGRANVDNAGGGGEHLFLKADVFDVLDDMARGDERFDLVIVDPPTYSKTRGSRWTSGKSWVDLATRALAVTGRGGRVLCTSNDRRLTQPKFERYLRAALRADGRRGRVSLFPPPADYPPAPGGEPHLKSGVIELR